MTLGAEDVQAAELLHLVVLGLDRGLRLREGLVPARLVLLGRLLRVEAPLLERGDGHELGVATEHDVGASTGHVGRHGDATLAPGLRDDGGLTLVVLRIEHLVRDALLAQQLRQALRLLDARRTDEDWLALAVTLGDVVGDGTELRVLGAVDAVGLVDALRRVVRRDRDDAQLVDLVQLGGLGLGRTRHARQLVVHAEVVLQRHRRERLVLVLDLDAFLGLDRLVHTLVVATSGEHAAGVLVDDEDLAVHRDVVLVALEQFLRLDGVVEVADERRVLRLVEVLDAEQVLDLLNARLEQADGLLLLVDLVVARLRDLAVLALLRARQVLDDRGELDVPLRRRVGRAGDDERRAGLVDEDRVDLVDDGEVVAALHELVRRPGHVVAQVVEAELVVRAVRDVLVVLVSALRRRHRRQDAARLEPERAVHAAHELGLVLGEVVVDGDDVDALAFDRVEVARQCRDERLALTGAHLGDVAHVQRGTTHDLHVEVTLADRALARLAHGGERLGQDLIKALPVRESLAEPVGLLAQFGVGELFEILFDDVHLSGDRLELLERSSFAGAQNTFDNLGHARLRKSLIDHLGRRAVLTAPHARWRPTRGHSSPKSNG